MMNGVETMILLGAASILFGAGVLWIAYKQIVKNNRAHSIHIDALGGVSASSVDVKRSGRLVGPVSKVSREYLQPKGGLIPVKWAERISFSGGPEALKDGMLSPQAVGMVVDYLSRLMLFGSATQAFDISLKGAALVGDKDLAYADSLCMNITGLDDNSIRCACKLVAYDTAYRRGPLEYLLYGKPAQDVDVTENDIFNIRLLVSRFLEFAKTYTMVQAGTDFPGAYTSNVCAGDCDFIGSDTLWDMKCTKTGATNKMSLQLAMYYYMGKRSEHVEAYASITKIGVFNPKLNKCWVWDMTQIPPDVEATILHDVLGYA